MRELIAITDVTTMRGGQVCIAGVNRDFKCIRPVLDRGVTVWNLFKDGESIIYPSAKIELDLTPTDIDPPHIEDATFDPESISAKGRFEGKDWETLLRKTSFDSVEEMFDGYLQDRKVAPGTATRSLGTLSGVDILNLSIDDRHDRRTYRMDFQDSTGASYQRFPVNDMAFRAYYEDRISRSRNIQRAESQVLANLRCADRVYLRLGLTRPAEIGGYDETCWSQVTGVYTFTDYLGGKKFTDFDW